MSVITAITAQNTCGVYAIQEVNPNIVEAQLDAVFTDIFPDSVKIGMVSSSEMIKIISKKLKQFNAKSIVLDPVMISTSGHRLLDKDAEEVLKNELMPIADIITPNILKQLAKEAKVNIYCQDEVPVYANEFLFCIHVGQGGLKAITLPESVREVKELYTNQEYTSLLF